MIITEQQILSLINVARYCIGILQAAKHDEAVQEILDLLSKITGQQSEKQIEVK